MAKILSYGNKRSNAVIVAALALSIIITNVFVILTPNENARFYNASITSTITIGVALIICPVQVYRYKKRRARSQHTDLMQTNANTVQPSDYFYDDNKMHLSICLFLGLWFVAHVIWTFPYQQSSEASIADALWFIGYALFGYFLYSLYYHFFKREFEPLVLVLIAIVISIFLILVLDIIVSILRLLSTQPVDFSILLVTLVYPILDAVLIFPAILIFWGARRSSRSKENVTVREQEQEKDNAIQRERDTSFSFPHGLTSGSSIWLLLLSIAMGLSAIGDTGFAFSTAYGPDSVQRDVWIWDVIYNADHLCLAAAVIGYGSFFSLRRSDKIQY
jgi:hypothetical protein